MDVIITVICHTSYYHADVWNIYLCIFSRGKTKPEKYHYSDRGISLECSISVGKSLSVQEISFCTILSNALENTMHALEKLKDKDKWAKLTISNKNNHLLLSLENPVEQIPVFVDGIPVSRKTGHGIGIKSMVYYTEKLHGQCHFSVTNQRFVLKIII